MKEKLQAKGPSFVFGSSDRDLGSKEDQPGPGQYDIKSFVEENGAVKKGTTLSYRTNLMNSTVEVPGPGAYDDRFGRISGLDGTMFGKEEKFFHSKQNEKEHQFRPGVGEYTPEYNLKLPFSSAITIPKETKIEKVQDVPGPGAYQPFQQSTIVKDNGGIFGKDPRDVRPPESHFNPGPGDYNSHIDPQFFESHMAFGREKQRADWDKRDTPGPGKYYKPETASNGITFPKEVKKIKDNGVPGPGKYDIKSTVADVPKYLIPGVVKQKQ